MRDLTEAPTIVVGASRGFGRGIATAYADAGARVVAVARTAEALAELAAANPRIRPEIADAADPVVAGVLLDRYDPVTLIVVAGASPLMRPLHHQTWETFSVAWNVDVRITFQWLREALLKPLRAGSRIIVISSGAAVNGSPLSGGYAGAKATQRFATDYAGQEARRLGLDITVTAVLPHLTPETQLGQPAVHAYAARAGQPLQDYLERLGDPLTPDAVGAAVLDLGRTDPNLLRTAYRLTTAGLQDLP